MQNIRKGGPVIQHHFCMTKWSRSLTALLLYSTLYLACCAQAALNSGLILPTHSGHRHRCRVSAIAPPIASLSTWRLFLKAELM